MNNKPPYSIPSMTEIKNISWNGYTVASTFSGCGGSCLGYRMAGFKVIWANEFVPIAQESYRANAENDCFLDCRDIRQIKAEDILRQLQIKKGELDLFDGSPPCQAFSTAGKREKGWGKLKTYEHGAMQCNETLFDEYIRLLRGLEPKVFIAENVSGLIKGTAKGYFLKILKEMKLSGYQVTCRVLDAQWLGVPQARQRTIFIGVRNDLNKQPVFPAPLKYRYSVKEAIPWICSAKHKNGGFKTTQTENRPSPTITATQCQVIVEKETKLSGAVLEQWKQTEIGKSSPKYFSLIKLDTQKPSPTIIASSGTGVTLPDEPRRLSIMELKRLCSFPDDFILVGSYSKQWERLGNSVPPLMMKAVAETIRDEILNEKH